MDDSSLDYNTMSPFWNGPINQALPNQWYLFQDSVMEGMS